MTRRADPQRTPLGEIQAPAVGARPDPVAPKTAGSAAPPHRPVGSRIPLPSTRARGGGGRPTGGGGARVSLAPPRTAGTPALTPRIGHGGGEAAPARAGAPAGPARGTPAAAAPPEVAADPGRWAAPLPPAARGPATAPAAGHVAADPRARELSAPPATPTASAPFEAGGLLGTPAAMRVLRDLREARDPSGDGRGDGEAWVQTAPGALSPEPSLAPGGWSPSPSPLPVARLALSPGPSRSSSPPPAAHPPAAAGPALPRAPPAGPAPVCAPRAAAGPAPPRPSPAVTTPESASASTGVFPPAFPADAAAFAALRTSARALSGEPGLTARTGGARAPWGGSPTASPTPRSAARSPASAAAATPTRGRANRPPRSPSPPPRTPELGRGSLAAWLARRGLAGGELGTPARADVARLWAATGAASEREAENAALRARLAAVEAALERLGLRHEASVRGAAGDRAAAEAEVALASAAAARMVALAARIQALFEACEGEKEELRRKLGDALRAVRDHGRGGDDEAGARRPDPPAATAGAPAGRPASGTGPPPAPAAAAPPPGRAGSASASPLRARLLEAHTSLARVHERAALSVSPGLVAATPELRRIAAETRDELCQVGKLLEGWTGGGPEAEPGTNGEASLGAWAAEPPQGSLGHGERRASGRPFPSGAAGDPRMPPEAAPGASPPAEIAARLREGMRLLRDASPDAARGVEDEWRGAERPAVEWTARTPLGTSASPGPAASLASAAVTLDFGDLSRRFAESVGSDEHGRGGRSSAWRVDGAAGDEPGSVCGSVCGSAASLPRGGGQAPSNEPPGRGRVTPTRPPSGDGLPPVPLVDGSPAEDPKSTVRLGSLLVTNVPESQSARVCSMVEYFEALPGAPLQGVVPFWAPAHVEETIEGRLRGPDIVVGAGGRIHQGDDEDAWDEGSAWGAEGSPGPSVAGWDGETGRSEPELAASPGPDGPPSYDGEPERTPSRGDAGAGEAGGRASGANRAADAEGADGRAADDVEGAAEALAPRAGGKPDAGAARLGGEAETATSPSAARAPLPSLSPQRDPTPIPVPRPGALPPELVGPPLPGGPDDAFDALPRAAVQPTPAAPAGPSRAPTEWYDASEGALAASSGTPVWPMGAAVAGRQASLTRGDSDAAPESPSALTPLNFASLTLASSWATEPRTDCGAAGDAAAHFPDAGAVTGWRTSGDAREGEVAGGPAAEGEGAHDPAGDSGCGGATPPGPPAGRRARSAEGASRDGASADAPPTLVEGSALRCPAGPTRGGAGTPPDAAPPAVPPVAPTTSDLARTPSPAPPCAVAEVPDPTPPIAALRAATSPAAVREEVRSRLQGLKADIARANARLSQVNAGLSAIGSPLSARSGASPVPSPPPPARPAPPAPAPPAAASPAPAPGASPPSSRPVPGPAAALLGEEAGEVPVSDVALGSPGSPGYPPVAGRSLAGASRRRSASFASPTDGRSSPASSRPAHWRAPTPGEGLRRHRSALEGERGAEGAAGGSPGPAPPRRAKNPLWMALGNSDSDSDDDSGDGRAGRTPAARPGRPAAPAVSPSTPAGGAPGPPLTPTGSAPCPPQTPASSAFSFGPTPPAPRVPLAQAARHQPPGRWRPTDSERREFWRRANALNIRVSPYFRGERRDP